MPHCVTLGHRTCTTAPSPRGVAGNTNEKQPSAEYVSVSPTVARPQPQVYLGPGNSASWQPPHEHGMFIGIPDPFPQMSVAITPTVTTRNVVRYCHTSPGRQTGPQREPRVHWTNIYSGHRGPGANPGSATYQPSVLGRGTTAPLTQRLPKAWAVQWLKKIKLIPDRRMNQDTRKTKILRTAAGAMQILHRSQS